MTKTKTYTQLLKQIETLQIEAERLRREEIDGVIARIREAIVHYGLTAGDLGLGAGAAPAKTAKAGKAPARKTGKAAAAKKAAKPPKPIKYRDEAGRGWGGIGKRPQWLRDALAAGKSLKDFEVTKN